VIYRLAWIANGDQDPNNLALAAQYARELIVKHPKSGRMQCLLAWIKYRAWFNAKTRASADEAIAAFGRAAELCPPGSEAAASAKDYMSFIDWKQKQWEAKGKN
jgi:hypothetical protein